jgi:hypothetical protein
LEALRSLAAWVQDLVLDNVDGSSLLATSMSTVAERLEGQIDAPVANGVCSGSHSALVAIVSHFPELDADLEVLRSRHNTRLAENEVDVLWSQVRASTDSVASHVPPSIDHKPLDSAEE